MEVKFAETRANDRATILAKNLQSGPNCIILRANEKKKKERKKEIYVSFPYLLFQRISLTCSARLLLVPRAVLKEQYQGDVEVDEVDLMHQFEEGFDRADFRAEFSPSPNLEGPQSQPRDNVSRNFPTVSSSPPRARTNNDGE